MGDVLIVAYILLGSGWGNSIVGETVRYRRMPIRGSYPKLTNCRHTEDMDCLPHAVCYDCVCLMPLIWITMPLSSDGDGTVNRTGHDRDYDGSPAGLLGCLPRRLCLLWGYGGDDATSDEDQ